MTDVGGSRPVGDAPRRVVLVRAEGVDEARLREIADEVAATLGQGCEVLLAPPGGEAAWDGSRAPRPIVVADEAATLGRSVALKLSAGGDVEVPGAWCDRHDPRPRNARRGRRGGAS